MKRSIPILMAIGAMLITSPLFAEPEHSFVKEFDLNVPADVEIRTSGGFIRAEGSNTGKATVYFVVKKRGKLLDISLEELREMADVEIESSGNKLYVSVRNHNNWGWRNNVNVSFVVKAPKSASLDLKTSGGSITASNFSGSHDIHTSGGSLKFDRLEGDIEAHTSGGSIKFNDSQGNISARTSGGSIRADGLEGVITFSTSGGSISLQNISGAISARTSGGRISADITNLKDQLVLKTSGGSISATIPSDLGLDLNLRGNRVNADLRNFSGAIEKDKIRGKLNGGGILVDMGTSGGSVNLAFN